MPFPAFLIQILIVLAIAGVFLWAITQFPIDAQIVTLIRVVIVVCVAIWLLYALLGMVGPGFYPLRH